MDRLKMALALIQEAEEEKKRLEVMEKEKSKCSTWREACEVEARYNPIPRKSVVNDCIKMARRLLARAYM